MPTPGTLSPTPNADALATRFFTRIPDPEPQPDLRDEIRALRREIRDLRDALVPAVSPIVTGPVVLAEYAKLQMMLHKP